jgi:hypothetical protein
MAIAAAEARRWITRLRSALHDFGRSGAASEPTLSPVLKRTSSRMSACVCSSSDAEFQIMLSELHYPPVREPVANAILTATGERL